MDERKQYKQLQSVESKDMQGEKVVNSNVVTGKPALMKRINRNLIIKLIIKQGEISRSQLAKMTGLALPSVMRIVDSLVEEGLVEETRKGDSTGGRKPNLIRLNRDYKVIVGIEIAIQSSIVITDFGGAPLARWSSGQMAYMTPEVMLEMLLEQMQDMLSERNIEPEQVAGIGIGTPGMNFKYQNEVKRSILKGWEQIDVKSWFASRTPYSIVVDNVARTRTLSEQWFGLGREYKSFLYVFVDQGVGVGIMNNGVIYEGAMGAAGEFGHMSIDINGRPCYCGKKGCIEMYVSAGALTNEADQLGICAGASEAISFEAIIKRENEPEVRDIFVRGGQVLAFGIANLINLYNPPVVILGGIVPKLSKALVEEVNLALEAFIFHNDACKTPVLLSALDNEQFCLGSIALVIDDCFKTVEL